MGNFIFALFGVIFLQLFMLFLGYRYHLFALITVTVASLLIPVFAETDGWTWFTWVKTYSISVPIIFYSLLNYLYSQDKKFLALEKIFPIILLLNMLEAGAIGLQRGLSDSNVFLIINAVSLIILGLLAPMYKKWKFGKYKTFGFDDEHWIYANTVALTYFYLFSPEYGTLTMSAVLAIVIPQIVVLFLKDTASWFASRAYMLIVIVTIKACFDFINIDYLHPAFINKEQVLTPLIETPIGYLFILANVGTLIYFIYNRFFKKD
jgi:hypothetical protein